MPDARKRPARQSETAEASVPAVPAASGADGGTDSGGGEAQGALQKPGNRLAFAGFFLTGVLTSSLGALLPAWGHHRTFDYEAIGGHFLALGIGLPVAARLGLPMLERKGVGAVLLTASLIAFLSLLFLALVGPPFPVLWRIAGSAGIGAAAGLLNAAVFHALAPMYRQNPAATVNLAGAFFGLGCLATALLVAGTFETYNAASILILLSLVPGFFSWTVARARLEKHTEVLPAPPPLLREFRSPAAVLFSMLLFFQFANEGALAGWLTLFLIKRIGLSPTAALLLLALYWMTLLLGRLLGQALLTRLHHGYLLLNSVAAAMFGCFLLAFTNNLFGASIGILAVSLGFAFILPLVFEKIGARFPHYHPGVFNGLFSLSLAGGLLAPGLLGFAAASLDSVRPVLLIPMAGSIIVFLLVVLIWLESQFGSGKLSAG